MTDKNLHNSFQKIIEGVRKFQMETYPEKQALFQSLARQQNPKILFITCSDSRIDPALIMQTEPGDIFTIQNAGNIIPPYGVMYGGTSASIEFAVTVLNVEHIVVCGHSDCGAMKALVNDTVLDEAPQIENWLSYAKAAKAVTQAELKNETVSDTDRLYHCTQKNVEVQLNHLKTIPCVAAHMASGELQLHGWMYYIGRGQIRVYNDAEQEFIEFEDAYKF